jgi:hypothetical protein
VARVLYQYSTATTPIHSVVKGLRGRRVDGAALYINRLSLMCFTALLEPHATLFTEINLEQVLRRMLWLSRSSDKLYATFKFLYDFHDKNREDSTDHLFKFIALSAIIGGGIFSNNGEALEVSGPVGMILSVVTIGIISISVSEGISELVQQFPAPNAIVEYVSVFVDKDLGWVVGVAYWYTAILTPLRLHYTDRTRYAFASVFAVQNLAAAQLSTYWDISSTWQTLAFYVLAPIAILAINFFGVFVRHITHRD